MPDAEPPRGAMRPLAAAALIAGTVAVVATLGRRASPTDAHPAIRDWYNGLDKPGFTPPPAVFGLAWPVIEGGLAVATYRLLRRPRSVPRDVALAVQAVTQAGLVGWNELFFGRRAMGQGTLLAGALVASAGSFTALTAREDRAGALASAPLPAWLSFATLLSWSVWRRNPERPSDALAPA